jgi:hypothetical protein
MRQKKSYVSIWNWIERFAKSPDLQKKKVTASIIDETIIQIENKHYGYGYVTKFSIQFIIDY